MSELPAWVKDRCYVAGTARNPGNRATIDAALAEFLAILEERGLRVDPRWPTRAMLDASHRTYNEITCRWQAMQDAAPPLAELLGGSDAD